MKTIKAMIVKGMAVLLCSLATLTAAPAAKAQDLDADLRRMYQAYDGLDGFAAVLRIEVFERWDVDEPVTVQTGYIGRKGELLRYKMDDTEILNGKNNFLVVDHARKVMSVQPKREGDFWRSTIANLDSILDNLGKWEYWGAQSGRKHYIIESPRKMIAQTHLFLNEETGLIDAVEYRYNRLIYKENNKVRVSFENLRTNPRFPAVTFAEKTFIDENDGRIQPVPQYGTYKLFQN